MNRPPSNTAGVQPRNTASSSLGRLLLLSTTTGYQAGMFREAAARMGVPLALASDRCHVLEDPWQDGAIPVRFEQPEEAARRIVEFARQSPITGLVAIGDQPTLTASLAAGKLSISYHPPDAVRACRNKFDARERYRAAGLKVPWYRCWPAAEDPASHAGFVPYPCVLKPLGLSGSRGVIRANDAAEFVVAFRRIAALLREPDVRKMREDAAEWIQVEGYISGEEVAVEGLLTRGRLRILALFDKPDPLDGPYFEETIYVTPSRLGEAGQEKIAACVEKAAAALGLWHGPLHAELRLNAEGAWMLDMAARPIGGLCAGAVRFDDGRRGDGMGLEELILRHALGEPVDELPREKAASGVMMIPIPAAGVLENVENIDAARSVPGIGAVEITAKLGQQLVPLPEGSSYLGFIFARGESPEFVEAALRRAHQALRFVISASLPVVRSNVSPQLAIGPAEP